MEYLRKGMVLVVVLMCCKVVFAQFTTQHLDNGDGLSNSCINSVYQDSDHLIWFGTWDGLNYYDGENFHVFNYEKSGANKNSIASNIIYNITGDSKRNIWIGTIQGLSRFNKSTGNFTNYFYNSKKVAPSGYTVAVNKSDAIYTMRRNSAVLYRYDEQRDSFNAVKFVDSEKHLLKKIQFDATDNLWILRDSGDLGCYTATASGLIKAPTVIKDVADIFFCNGSVFYVTDNRELYRVQNAGEVYLVARLPHEVRAMDFYQGYYHFAWASKGLGEYDANFKPANFFSGQYGDLQNIRITSMLSAEDLLWLGTDGSGVFKIAKKEDYFGLINRQPGGQSFHIPVRAFCRVGTDLWVGTKGNGIITIHNFDKKNITFGNIKSFHSYSDLLDNCIYAIQKGKDGLIYIGSDAPGITLYDQTQKKLINWAELINRKKFPAFGSVHCILVDQDSSVWLGLNEGGLIHLKLDKDKNNKIGIKYLERFRYNELGNGPGSDVIYSLAAGSNNTIWIGCRYGGLSHFDKATKKFRTFKAFSYKGSLSNNDVLSLYKDNNNNLWVGTSFGLNWLNEADAINNAKPQFKKLTVDDGLPNNTVHAITEDKDGHIWLSTNKGLVRISPSNLKIVQFKEDDGLQNNEFSDNAVFKDSNGMLFFGGIAGFNYFLPKNIRLNTRQQNLLITNSQFGGSNLVGNGLLVLNKNNPKTNSHFTLGPRQNYFELNVQPITYNSHQKSHYECYLEGNDNAWHYMANSDKIVYNNLSPGNYTLKIRWSNEDGTWTQNVNVFSLTIRPYFWLTPLAYLLYAAALLACTYFYTRYRKNKFLMRQELKMEHVMREKDEQLHQQQLNFFTNIAHELQTPLTIISGSLDRYLYKTKSEESSSGSYFLSVVKKEALRLQYLVMQLMDFRKADVGFLSTCYTFLDVSHLLVNIAELFVPLAKPKSIDFSWVIDPGINIWVDKDKMEKIIYNLLSNAFKYATDNQYIILSVNQITENDLLEIVVTNSGCSLTDTQLQRLFDQFFIADANQQNKASSGIGLAFTRQLVTLLNGDIAVQCIDGWISFKVLLPLTFVPENNQRAVETEEKPERPSQVLKGITYNQSNIQQVSIDENNKNAMIKSFDQEDKKMILVVEDEQHIRFLLKDILSEHYIVYEASTGKEAIEVIHRMTPDLIISDVVMPDINGLELCNIIKSTPESCHIPFIILSARGTLEQQIEGYECGADAYLPKPFQSEHLLVRINALLQYHQKLHRFFSINSPGSILLDETDVKESDKHFIEQVVKIIEDNLIENLDGAFLQDATNMSKIQLYRKIKTLSNMTPTELIRYLRLQKSTELLRTSDLTVSEIFYRTGFNNKTYFFREFKRVYDCSPNAYRVQHRLPILK